MNNQPDIQRLQSLAIETARAGVRTGLKMRGCICRSVDVVIEPIDGALWLRTTTHSNPDCPARDRR